MTILRVVLTQHDFITVYGVFASRGAKHQLRSESVPEALHPLIHYAEFWCVSDDAKRESLVDAAPEYVKKNLVAVIAEFDDELDEWLAGPEADSTTPTPEYIAFSAMRMASDLV